MQNYINEKLISDNQKYTEQMRLYINRLEARAKIDKNNTRIEAMKALGKGR